MVWRQEAEVYRLATSCPILQRSLRLSYPQVLSLNRAPVGALIEFWFTQARGSNDMDGKAGDAVCNLTVPHHERVPGTHVVSDKDWRTGISQSGCFSVLVFKGDGQGGGREWRDMGWINCTGTLSRSGSDQDFKLGGPQTIPAKKISIMCLQFNFLATA